MDTAMAQSLAHILVHIIFSTKDRYPYLRPDCRAELHAYMATIFKSMESPAVIINSVDDHVHVLCRLSKNHALCDLIQKIKYVEVAQDQGRRPSQVSLAERVRRILRERVPGGLGSSVY